MLVGPFLIDGPLLRDDSIDLYAPSDFMARSCELALSYRLARSEYLAPTRIVAHCLPLALSTSLVRSLVMVPTHR